MIGDDNYIMGSGHVAHNSVVGNGCTIASCALVAGHVTVEDRAFISGGVVVHKFSKIGTLAMIGGNVRVNQDALPYCLHSDFNITPKGLNLVVLRRAGLARDTIGSLKQAYRLLFFTGLKLREALERIEREIPNEETLHLVGAESRSCGALCEKSFQPKREIAFMNIHYLPRVNAGGSIPPLRTNFASPPAR